VSPRDGGRDDDEGHGVVTQRTEYPTDKIPYRPTPGLHVEGIPQVDHTLAGKGIVAALKERALAMTRRGEE
jgi:hypothetical protein